MYTKDSNLSLFKLEPSWLKVLTEELQKPYFVALTDFISREYSTGIPVYPPQDLVFNAFNSTPFDRVKVVIVGQDPYHAPNQAHGLCFSVPEGTKFPPSLRNIFKEQFSDLGCPIPAHGCLNHWAEQGVLLLNATLTVRQGKPLSHHGLGWERFTDAVIAKLIDHEESVIFVLWGKSAQEKCLNLKSYPRHPVLMAAHPSPLSAYNGFFGCRHFSQINSLLDTLGKAPIKWR